jgi:hypothetical protein
MTIFTEGVKNTPTDNTKLAEAMPTTAASQPLRLLLTADAVCTVEVQHRDVANNSNLYTRRICLAANSAIELTLRDIVAHAGERIRVMTAGDSLGKVEAQIVMGV